MNVLEDRLRAALNERANEATRSFVLADVIEPTLVTELRSDAKRRSHRPAALALVAAAAVVVGAVGIVRSRDNDRIDVGRNPNTTEVSATTSAVTTTTEVPLPLAEAPPPAEWSPVTLWVSATEVMPGAVDLAAAVVNRSSSDADYGLLAKIERWDGREWVSHRNIVLCVDRWSCVARPTPPGQVLEVELIGLTAYANAVGPVLPFNLDGLDAGWYRISQTTNEGVVASAAIHVTPATQAAPAPLDLLEPRLSVNPGVIPSTGGVLSHHFSDDVTVDRAVAANNLSPTVDIERWTGLGWQPVTSVDVTPPKDGHGFDDTRDATIGPLPQAAYRLLRRQGDKTYVGNFWVDDILTRTSEPTPFERALRDLATADGFVSTVPLGDATFVSGQPTRPGALGQGAVVMSDGSLVEAPSGSSFLSEVVRVGGRVFVPNASGPKSYEIASLSVLDLTTRTWSELRLPFDTPRPAQLQADGDGLLVFSNMPYSNATGDPELHRVDSGLAMTELPYRQPTPPSAAGEQTTAVWTGDEWIVYGGESQGLPESSISQPYVSDTRYGKPRRQLSTPPWLGCRESPCAWYAPHQAGDRMFAVWTGQETFVSTNVGGMDITALHDPIADTWQRLPDAPIRFELPFAVAIGRDVVVLSKNVLTRKSPHDVALRFNLDTRRWSTDPLPELDPARQLCASDVGDAFVFLSCLGSLPTDKVYALDKATATWRSATAVEMARAQVVSGRATVETLLLTLKEPD